MPEYFNIGKIVATFGLQGEVVLIHKAGKKNKLKGIQTVFIEEKNNSFLPYFIESLRPKKDQELYLKLEDVHSKEAAGKLLQKQVYLREKDFRQIIEDDSILYYLGFLVKDKQAGILGSVAEVMETPSQLLLKVFQNKQELLIPLNENTLQSIDKEEKIISVDLPDGLLDIYQA